MYGLTYRMTDYCRQSVESIVTNASEPVNFTVVDSRSDCSEATKTWCLEALNLGRIQQFVAASSNSKAAGLDWAYREFPPDEDLFVFTDLDIVVPRGLDWVRLLREAHKTYCCVGWGLDPSNYVPPNSGHSDDGFGIWLVGLSRRFFDQHYPPGRVVVDSYLRTYASVGAVKLPQRLYHLGWDVWKDDPVYWQQKVAGVDWWKNPDATYEVYRQGTDSGPKQ